MENGFKAMSQHADDAGGGSEQRGQDGASGRLKTFGVDADAMTEAATERVSELQQAILDEVRARPMRALGWAVAAGVVVGFWAAK